MCIDPPRTTTAPVYYACWQPVSNGRLGEREAPPPSRRAGRHLLLVCAAFLGLILIAHGLMEGLELRFCQPWRMEDMHKVRFFQEEVPRVDVVYLGTSQIHDGIMPPLVQEETGLTGYNLAVPGANLEISWVLARDLLQGEKRPQVLVVGIFPVIMDANNRNALDFYCRYAALADIAEHVQEGNLPPSALATASLRGLENLLQAPLYPFKKPPLRYRPDYLRLSQGSSWLPAQRNEAFTVPATEWTKRQQHFATETDPVHPVFHFHDDSRPARTLLRLQALAAERGFHLLLVQPPQALEQPTVDARFRAWMTTFCEQHHLTYLDLHTGHHYAHADFADPIHLNARGAAKFSRQLAPLLLRHTASPPSPTSPTPTNSGLSTLALGRPNP